MEIYDSPLELASKTREKLFMEAGDDVDIVVSSNTQNKGYLSGYFSMSHELNPRYVSAVVAKRGAAALVVSAADAGPALETIGNPELIFRYGFFCFESYAGIGPGGYDQRGEESFEDALLTAVNKIARNSDVIGVDRSNGDAIWDLIQQRRSANKIVDVTNAFAQSRKTKLKGEISRITAATKLVEAGLMEVSAQAQVGMTELDLASLISCQMMKVAGSLRFISVTSGPRSALADSFATHRKIEAGDLLRIDAGCIVQGYASDMARTFVFGEPDARQAAYYHAIKTGIEEELRCIRAGISATKLFEDTVEVVRQNGIPSYKRQHVGHGIGLNGGYDFPLIAPGPESFLEAGMSMCVETPYYELGWGGMMVEDTILVTEDGYEPITTIPRDLICIS